MSRLALHLPQRLTAFACTRDADGKVLMVQHRRLGVVKWELPGGHVDPNESVREAAARETLEETGFRVRVGSMIAEGLHQWEGRTVGIVYFSAERSDVIAETVGDEPGIEAVDWRDPSTLAPAEVSPLALPAIRHAISGAAGTLLFRATHHRSPSGWEPHVSQSWSVPAHHRVHATAAQTPSHCPTGSGSEPAPRRG